MSRLRAVAFISGGLAAVRANHYPACLACHAKGYDDIMTINDTDPRPCPPHCDGVFHTFLCFLGRLATDFNSSAARAGRALNAR